MFNKIFFCLFTMCAYSFCFEGIGETYRVISNKSKDLLDQEWLTNQYSGCNVIIGKPVFLLKGSECWFSDSFQSKHIFKQVLTDTVTFWAVPLFSEQVIGYSSFPTTVIVKYMRLKDSLSYVAEEATAYTLAELCAVWPSPKYHIAIIGYRYAAFYTILENIENNLTPILLTNAYADDPFIQRDLHQKYLWKKEPDINRTEKRLELTYDFFENITIKDLPGLAKKSEFRSPYPYSKTVKWIKKKMCSE